MDATRWAQFLTDWEAWVTNSVDNQPVEFCRIRVEKDSERRKYSFTRHTAPAAISQGIANNASPDDPTSLDSSSAWSFWSAH